MFEEDVDSIFQIYDVQAFSYIERRKLSEDLTMEKINPAEFRSEIASNKITVDRLIELVESTKSHVDYFLCIKKIANLNEHLNSQQMLNLLKSLNNKLILLFANTPHWLVLRESLYFVGRLLIMSKPQNGKDIYPDLMKLVKTTCTILVRSIDLQGDRKVIALIFTFLNDCLNFYKANDDFILSLLLLFNKTENFVVESCKFLFKVLHDDKIVYSVLSLFLFILKSKGANGTLIGLLTTSEMREIFKFIPKLHKVNGQILEKVFEIVSILTNYIEISPLLSIINFKMLSSIYFNFDSQLRTVHSSIIQLIKCIIVHKNLTTEIITLSISKDEIKLIIVILTRHLELFVQLSSEVGSVQTKLGIFITDLVWILNSHNTLITKLKMYKDIFADNEIADITSKIIATVLIDNPETLFAANLTDKEMVLENKYAMTRLVFLVVQNYNFRGRRMNAHLYEVFFKVKELNPSTLPTVNL